MFMLYHSEGCDIYERGLSWILYQRLVHYTCSDMLGHRRVPCVTHFHDQLEPRLPLSNTLEVAVENKAAIQFWKRLINRCRGFKLYCFGTLASKEILEVWTVPSVRIVMLLFSSTTLRPILLFANMGVSTIKMCLDTSLLAKSIMDRRE
jgi:hypothetical protein